MRHFHYLFSSLFLSLFIVACSTINNGNEVKEKIIPIDSLKMILIDIHIAESQVEELLLSTPDSQQVAFYKIQNIIFKKYKTDSITYFRSYNYYASQMKTLDTMYEGIVDSLSLMQSKAEFEQSIKLKTLKMNEMQLGILKQIKQLNIYQKDSLWILPSNKLYSNNRYIQAHIESLYNNPTRLEKIKTEAATNNLHEIVLIYKYAINKIQNPLSKE
ncbi:MAG: DUF4296 domain-containing protein [Cytophagales bacterium]|nr:MAG: DUF4296 domain-containing protein [Cytophagales bacterium]